ncbi:hypothetical protein CUMW_226230, partial [Citrus unshiu]
ADQPLGKLTAWEARSAAGTARGDPRPPPLDSPRSELSDLSFPSSLIEVRSPLTGGAIRRIRERESTRRRC